MPMAPPRACSTRGCPRYAAYRGKCIECARGHAHARATGPEQRFYGTTAWRALAARVRREDVLCAECLREGVHTFATQVDHVIPVVDAPALALVRENLVSLCTSCHSRKTMTEQNRNREPMR